MITSKYNEVLNVVSEKHALPISEVQDFANKFFSLLNKALEEDKMVKVKGLGTFKIVGVQDRESVNVNTGERMVISGHNKIHFTPDSTMRDRVNRPFLQFDTVVLGDKVNIDEIDIVSEAETKRILDSISLDPFAGIDSGDYTPTQKRPVVESYPIDAHVDSSEDYITDLSDNIVKDGVIPVADAEDDKTEDVTTYTEPVAQEDQETVPTNNENEVVEDEPLPETKPEEKNDESLQENCNTAVEEEPAVTATDVADKGIEEISEPDKDADEIIIVEDDNNTTAVDDSDDSVSVDDEDGSADADDTEEDEEDSNSHCKLYWIISTVIMVLVALLVGFLAGKYYAENISSEPKLSETLNKPKPKVTTKVDSVNKDTIKSIKAKEVNNKSQNVISEKVSSTEKIVTEVKQEAKPQVDVKQPVTDGTDYGAMDARVRTGAYAIVGLDQTVTVKAGETLKKISNKFLGPDMECYLEVYNGTKEVKEGQTIKIPKLVLKKKLAKKI